MLWLLIIYSVTVLVRYLLAKITTSFPTVGIDEFLYYSLARSIATKGELLFRGQSADYAYILYPLFLSPVYALFPDGSSFYRILQAWNTMLMSTSIFPIFFLSKELLQSEKKAFGATAAAMLLPDFILGELIFSEAILYPLFFTLMYCAFRHIRDKKISSILMVGLIGGLLYSTKPGSVVPAIVFIGLSFMFSLIRKEKREAIYAISSLIILLSTSITFFALAKYILGYSGNILSIYSSQIDGTISRNIAAFLKALALYPVYFILACGIIGFVYPFFAKINWSRELRAFWWYTIISLFIMIVGSAWAVEQITSLNNIHLRYIAMYIPLMLLFCCIPLSEAKTHISASPFYSLTTTTVPLVVLGYVLTCILILGCKAKAQTTDVHAMISLSILNDSILPSSKQTLGNIVIVLLSILAAIPFVVNISNKARQRISLFVMIGCLLVNGLVAYSLLSHNIYPLLEKDGIQVHALTKKKPYVFLLSAEGITDIGVDVNTKNNNFIVYTNDFINCLQRNEGVYVPYIPEQMRGMASVSETPDVDTLVVSYESMSCFQLSQYATAESPFDRNTIFVVHFTPNKRIVDSTLGNLSNRVLSVGKPGILLLYNDDYLQRPITISLDVESEIEQELIMNSTHELKNITVSAGRAWYDVSFDSAEDAFNFQTQIAPITVYAYKLSFPN